MELFDKKFVYFMWDDKLEGQKGFVANYINELKLAVNQGYWTKYGPLHKGSDAYPFRTIEDERWCLCYCDPNYEWKKDFNEGKKLQYLLVGGIDWQDIDSEDDFLYALANNKTFRIKPEEKVCPCADGIDSKACVGCEHSEDGKKKYRPYESPAEMIVDFIDRFKVKCPSYCEPLIWVRLKVDKRKRLIVAYGDNFVEIGNKTKAVTLQHLFEQYEFLDGGPVGMEVKE